MTTEIMGSLTDVDLMESETISDLDSGFGPSIAAQTYGPSTRLSSGVASDSSDSDSGSEYDPTIASGVYSNVENGRKYHVYREGQYVLPNDEREKERLELYHLIFLEMLDGALHIAPLNDPRMILDIGTGTGEWAIDMAEMYPDAQIVGNDLSPIQPSWSPPNLRFEVDDAESPWTYPPDTFDYVHMRCIGGCFKDWGLVLQEAYDHMQPGGYIEFQDFSGDLFIGTGDLKEIDPWNPVSPLDQTPFVRWWDCVLSASRQTERSFQYARDFDQKLIDAGFVDVEVCIKPWPVTRWPENERLNRIGKVACRGMVESLSSYSYALLTRVSGWTKADVVRLCADAKQQLLEDKDSRYWCQVYYIHARKPQA